MSHLARYLRTHLAGSTAGVNLFDRAAGEHPEPAASVLRRIHGELVEERVALRAMMAAVGVHENPVFNLVASAGERLGRLKPNGSLLHRTAMTDLVELETMSIALAGKLNGWESLLTLVDDEPRWSRDELECLAQQARDQRDVVRDLHAEAAARALG
ncbi:MULTISPECIES: hypothetical protein [unclassified Nocardioides]|uniref:hypothetical protein n=1 Tax=unclassified Nocardioides TaxID=2615069 RepID=UPI0006F206C3|nr:MULTISPECIES: hypothetical protein [unclassified Nocardioides]KRA38843.1 hypothetical protein ASD81_09705 [Nocardioides sp. Root614]KRA92803.1 hypothetical protein ASD84_09970 [Nocardioides sp. Root682]